MKKFEWRFPRSDALPCESVSRYNPERYADEHEWVSDDELDLPEGLSQRFGPGLLRSLSALTHCGFYRVDRLCICVPSCCLGSRIWWGRVKELDVCDAT